MSKAKSSKKVEKIVTDDGDVIKETFEYFDNIKVDPREVKTSMKTIGFDNRNPTVYSIVAEVDNPDTQKAGNVQFEQFVTVTNSQRAGKETNDELRKVFDLFLDGDNRGITFQSFQGVANELGVEDGELKEMFDRVAKNGVIDEESFYTLMNRDLSNLLKL